MESQNNPLISVIMATHNRGNIIHHAINSVLFQTYRNWELLVVMDGCTDNTIDVLKQYDDKRIKIFNKDKMDYYTVVRNYGINQSKGDLLAFRDDDGVWHPRFFEEMMKPHETEDVLVTYCGRAVFQDYALSKIKDTGGLLLNVPDAKSKLVQWQGKETLADEVDVGDIMIKRSAFNKDFTGFTEERDNPGYCSDAKLIDRIMKENKHGKIVMVPKYLHMYFTKHDGREQMTFTKLRNREIGNYNNKLETRWTY